MRIFGVLAAIAIACGSSSGCAIYCSAYATSGCLTAEELRSLGDRGRDQELVEYLHDQRGWVREEAALALGRARVGAAREGLEGCLIDAHERAYVRAASAEALGQLQDPRSIGALTGVASSSGTPPEVKIAAIHALCALSPESGAEGAVQAIAPLSSDEDLLVAAVAQQSVALDCGRRPVTGARP